MKRVNIFAAFLIGCFHDPGSNVSPSESDSGTDGSFNSSEEDGGNTEGSDSGAGSDSNTDETSAEETSTEESGITTSNSSSSSMISDSSASQTTSGESYPCDPQEEGDLCDFVTGGCPSGLECARVNNYHGECFPYDGDQGGGITGDPCDYLSNVTDCRTGFECAGWNFWPAGQCDVRCCTPFCFEDLDCPAGMYCSIVFISQEECIAWPDGRAGWCRIP